MKQISNQTYNGLSRLLKRIDATFQPVGTKQLETIRQVKQMIKILKRYEQGNS